MNKVEKFLALVFSKHVLLAYFFANMASCFVLFLMCDFEAAMAAGFAVPLYLIPAIITFLAFHQYKPDRWFKHIAFAVLTVPFLLYMGIFTLCVALSKEVSELYMYPFMIFLPALAAGLVAYIWLLTHANVLQNSTQKND